MQSEITTVNLSAQPVSYVCPQCQVDNRPSAKYCRKCGIPRIEKEATVEVAVTDQSFEQGGNQFEQYLEPSLDQNADQRLDQGFYQTTDRCCDNNLPTNADLIITPDEQASPKLILSSDLGITSQIATEPCVVSDTTSIFSNIVWETTPQVVPEQAITQRQCASCQTRIRMTDKYCIWCGTKQPASTSLEFKTCSFCLVPIPAKAGYCSLCGITVEANYNQEGTARSINTNEIGSISRDTTEEPVFHYEDDWLRR